MSRVFPSAIFLAPRHLGCMDFAYQRNVGDIDFKFVKQYGRVWRMESPMGMEVLAIADPKASHRRALHHCVHKADSFYIKRVETDEAFLKMMGKGLVWASGTRITYTYTPTASLNHIQLSQKWKDELQSSPYSDGMVYPVNKWFSRVTLDILGETAFDYSFGAIDNKENEVSSAVATMFNDSRLHPSKLDLLFKRTWYMVPQPGLQLMRYIPTKEDKRFRRCRKVIDRVSQQLIDEKREALLAESKSNQDIFSVLVRANELVAQMATLILAGHATTASTLTWMVYELARNQDYQNKMREEIVAARSRLHESAADDVIPLEQPVRTTSGKYVTEIPVAAGQQILFSKRVLSMTGSLPEVWGKDADVWNPMRFVDGDLEKQSGIGLYANLLILFFSIAEALAIIVELVEHFRFEPTEDTAKVIRLPSGLMSALTVGKEHEGPQMLVKVSSVL
ncbi:uncharacterized protein PHACADRAFT_165799 [Phanerochaete carnosa HHB-10118-sp]|uniref:Cytochrome P450 n=1 Tax=Phanerochaete carnosa (strain HHB-10118-sp) TaxID=650164 RepID=K5WLN1_PHACS|nr:uncharacterized protein PHACADRAFT_165799 [Phanerochaete carnosa HHB-10118-sp]EKM51202.1 hypothetical protein PHACADRAFT_165799 [Phanerochaete carnosa HHB-10118-sp]